MRPMNLPGGAAPQVPQGYGNAPAMPQHDFSHSPIAQAFALSQGPGLSGLAQNFHQNPGQFDGGFGQYLQSLRAAPASPQMPPAAPPPMPPQGGPPPGMGWRRPDFPGQGNAYGRMGMRPMQGQPMPQMPSQMPSWLQSRFAGGRFGRGY